ncbi:hypothetical protein CREGCYN_09060 [Synechococcus sp. M16CYN]
MPILRHTTKGQSNQNEAFNKSIASVPMAMSLMINSLVNMMQNNFISIRNNATKLNLDENGY